MAASHSRSHDPGPQPLSGAALRLAAAFTKVPREAFEAAVSAARGPRAITSPPPTDVLRAMLSGLELNGTERVLCIGGAVGYPVALLSHLAREVHAVEIEAALLNPQHDVLAQLGRTNVSMARSDAVRGKHVAAPFQAIVVTCAAPELPPALIDELAVGGRIVIPLGDAQGQLLELLEKRTDTLVSRTLGGCVLPMFPSLERTPSTFPWSGHREPR
jgi:protein-L-isoaspartate(D-aspartate) O-methyltransferase